MGSPGCREVLHPHIDKQSITRDTDPRRVLVKMGLRARTGSDEPPSEHRSRGPKTGDFQRSRLT